MIKACEALGWGSRLHNGSSEGAQPKRQHTSMLPKITFIVVQKRHHTRFFPSQQHQTKNGNIIPGE